LLSAGLDTTANMIVLGAFTLLRDPGQLTAVHADPGAAIEELLRYAEVVALTGLAACHLRLNHHDRARGLAEHAHAEAARAAWGAAGTLFSDIGATEPRR
jgi:hypothetical protein